MTSETLHNMTEDYIILDQGSTSGIISNPDMVTYLKKVLSELYIAKNGRNTTFNTKSKAKYLDYGKAWFDEKFFGIICSFSKLIDKYCITYNYNNYDVLYIHIHKRGPAKFKRTPEGLYYIDINTINK